MGGGNNKCAQLFQFSVIYHHVFAFDTHYYTFLNHLSLHTEFKYCSRFQYPANAWKSEKWKYSGILTMYLHTYSLVGCSLQKFSTSLPICLRAINTQIQRCFTIFILGILQENVCVTQSLLLTKNTKAVYSSIIFLVILNYYIVGVIYDQNSA